MRVPDPKARIWFDGVITSQTGKERVFYTPALKTGSTPRYEIRVSWTQDGREVTQTRTVIVAPGQATRVDFSK